jgi:hypothetical protein
VITAAGAAREEPRPLQALSSRLARRMITGKNLVLFILFSNTPAYKPGNKYYLFTIISIHTTGDSQMNSSFLVINSHLAI